VPVLCRLEGLREDGFVVAEHSSLVFVGDRAVITYDVTGSALAFGHLLKLRVLPVAWFYERA
jgi:hypothetical protein